MAARWLGLRVRIPPGAWMCVACECCVLTGRGLCFGLIVSSEEAYGVRRVCDRESSIMKAVWLNSGCRAITKNKKQIRLICSVKVKLCSKISTSFALLEFREGQYF
jgi:hypothetical protein